MVNHRGRTAGLLYAVSTRFQVLRHLANESKSTYAAPIQNLEQVRAKLREIGVKRAMRDEGIRLAEQWPFLGQ
jgi:hypothetical protein